MDICAGSKATLASEVRIVKRDLGIPAKPGRPVSPLFTALGKDSRARSPAPVRGDLVGTPERSIIVPPAWQQIDLSYQKPVLLSLFCEFPWGWGGCAGTLGLVTNDLPQGSLASLPAWWCFLSNLTHKEASLVSLLSLTRRENKSLEVLSEPS